MAEATTARPRPLSPHLQIYRPLISMVMSIIHRATGVALYAGTLLLAWWLIAAASGPAPFATFARVAASIPGQLVLVGYTWALIHHMLGGLRHFLWDTGLGFELGTVRTLSWLTIVGSIVLTAVIWAGVLKLNGTY